MLLADDSFFWESIRRKGLNGEPVLVTIRICLLYTSDAADE